ncbi:hypothetical protein SDC9_111359 [bioreactor metagenome]|uniref:Uncharacterized protein n=1 Tax=bioreactor metagenome TaxID=1076179 RepID=A0A645BMG4_9ZZZZ
MTKCASRFSVRLNAHVKRRTRRVFAPVLVSLGMCVFAGPCWAQATAVNFDDLACDGFIAIPPGYGGLGWMNGYCMGESLSAGTGYQPGTTSPTNVGLIGLETPTSSLTLYPASGVFTLYSGQFTAAWNDNLQLTIEGFQGATSVGTQTVTLSATEPTRVTFTGLLNVNKVVLTSSGGTPHAGYTPPTGGGGTHFAFDDLEYFLGMPRDISAIANPPAGGSISCTPNPVVDGGTAICTATANPDYTLADITGCTSVTDNTCTLSNVTEPAKVVANFKSTSVSPAPVPGLGVWGIACLSALATALGARRFRTRCR